MPKHVSQMTNSIYRAWLVEGLDLARSLARRIGHSQPWNLGLRRARRDTFLVRGGLPGGYSFMSQILSSVSTWGAGEGSVRRGHGALLSAKQRSRRGLPERSRGGGGEAGERGWHLGQDLGSGSKVTIKDFNQRWLNALVRGGAPGSMISDSGSRIRIRIRFKVNR